MKTLALAMRTRSAQRRNDGGYAAVMVMCLVLLLSATGLVIVNAAKSSQNATREGRAFVVARTNMNTALAEINNKFQKDAPTVGGANGSGTGTITGGGTYKWTVLGSGGTPSSVQVEGTFDGKTQVETYPLRARYVTSAKDNSEGSKAYGVAAGGPASNSTLYQGLWSNSVATQADSTFKGTFTGTPNVSQWDVFGGTVTTTVRPTYITTYSGSAKAVSPSGTTYASNQSAFQGYLDPTDVTRRRSAGAQTDCVAPSCYTYPGSVTLGGWTSPATGVLTLVVSGNLTLNADITTASATDQVHIYVTGSVTFTTGGSEAAGSPRTLTRVFISAPNGTCTGQTRVVLTGALACKSVQMTNTSDSIGWLPPLATPASSNVPTPAVVYFVEHPGFKDSRP